MRQNKKGISPVIATVLLVLLALVIALIVFLWARSWFGEKIQKDLGEGKIMIDEACKSVGFRAEVVKDGEDIKVAIENTKNVPIYGVKIMKVNTGSKKTIGIARFPSSPGAVMAGQSYTFTDTTFNGLEAGNNVLLYPVLAGLTQNSNSEKEYTCTGDDIAVAVTIT